VDVKCLKKDIPIIKSILKECEDNFNRISQEQTITKIKTKLNLN
jgi:hypothetical protein